MLKLVFALVFLALASGQTIRPNISDTFKSEIDVEFHDVDGLHFGDGLWDCDYANDMAVENYTLDEGGKKRMVEVLQRYDMKEVFEINSYGHHDCSHRTVSGHLSSVFGFLKNSTYRGEQQYHHRTYQMWGVEARGIIVEVGIENATPDRPYIFRRKHAADETFYFFRSFNATEPPASVFAIPSDCR
ncbi:uncharacterized protein LOC134187870 [Corticium candelabrum]|uniref:uncharacterized protein LOC134187870 n=1 Tax=Corticium candelabrum TaxID=121492 RepID=UPI002E26E9DE|nr:uncharacterized protein LOC134187870 [Corticium candelabrum]